MANKVQYYRKQANLTQRQLAAKAGTSQQQIQRIETGVVAARVELAVVIANVLGIELTDLFPEVRPLMKQRTNRGLSDFDLEPATLAEYESAGLETDIRIWTFKVILRGHEKAFHYIVPSTERLRLERRIDTPDTMFLVFDSGACSVVINLRDLVYCHFLYDVGTVVSPTHERNDVRVFISGDTEPWTFEVDEDRGTAGEEDDEGEFRMLLAWADMVPLDDVGEERFSFTDIDGERVHLRAADVALMEVPLWVVQGGHGDINDEDYGVEEEQAPDSSPEIVIQGTSLTTLAGHIIVTNGSE